MKFHRIGLLVGEETLRRYASSRVAIFGVGGVGSWTAEALIRSGIGRLEIIDPDVVAESNINRQLPALTSTVGRPKAEVLRERLLDINPEAEVTIRPERYTADTADSFDLSSYDAVVDAIDSLADKALLILRATAIPRLPFFSSMGAALKMDPTKVKVDEFWRVKGCPLAAALRNRFKRTGIKPRRKFRCVFSDEQPAPRRADAPADTSGAMTFGKVAVNGAACPVTATFGMNLAALVLTALRG